MTLMYITIPKFTATLLHTHNGAETGSLGTPLTITIVNLDSHGYQSLSKSVIQAMGTTDSCIVLFGNMSVWYPLNCLDHIPLMQSQNHMIALAAT
jgi:hypothetical protein